MATTAIVTDSTADLPSEVAAAAGLRIVPLYVRFGEEEFRDGVDLSVEQFWERLLDPASAFPSTASPSPGAFIEAFEACFRDGADGVVCLTIGSGISGTFGSASLAAKRLADRDIHVIDTQTTSMGTGILALYASELARTGASARDVAEAVRERVPDIQLFVAVDTMEYLRRNGRLSAARAAIGTVLSVKPIITMRDGLVVLAETPRTRGKARKRVIELSTEGPLERLSVLHTPVTPPEEVAEFRDALVSRIPGGIDPDHVTVGLIGASTGPHLGPGLMGAVFLRRH